MKNHDPCDVPTGEYVLWLPCHQAGLFGVAVRAHAWHPVNPGSTPGGVTTLSLCYNPPIAQSGLVHMLFPEVRATGCVALV